MIGTLLEDPNWDAPFFKVLAMNDTGAARGHQGGMVIPKDLRNYFPGLSGTTSLDLPTLDHRITAQLFVNGKFVGTADTRYQFQTWGGERKAESRLTDNLGPLRNRATGGDILIIQRAIDDLELYRLILVTQANTDHESIEAQIKGKRWGLLFTGEIPLRSDDLDEAEQAEKETEQAEFNMFDADAITTETRSMKMARSIVFRRSVLRIYNNKCCVCGESLITRKGTLEVQAAHIVSKSFKGSDDARNGLCLCIRHHWAFDNGLYGIEKNRTIYVPEPLREHAQNKPIADLHGKAIIEASEKKLLANPAALKWHMDAIVNFQS